MPRISKKRYEQVRDSAYLHIKNNSLPALKNYVKYCGVPLWKYNFRYSESDDILIYAMEVDASEELIEYIIKKAGYKNLNYHIKKEAKFNKEICEVNISPLMVALMKDRMHLFDKLIMKGATFTHMADHNQVNIIIQNLEFFDNDLNKKFKYIKKLLIDKLVDQIHHFYKKDLADEFNGIIITVYHRFIRMVYFGKYNELETLFDKNPDIMNEFKFTDRDLIKAGIKYNATEDILNLIIEQYNTLNLDYMIYDENVDQPVSPVVYAIASNKLKIAEQLIDLGADINYGRLENKKNNIIDYLYKNNQLNMLNLRFIISYIYMCKQRISEFNISLNVMENMIENEQNEMLILILRYNLYTDHPFKPLYKKAITSYNLEIFEELFNSDPLSLGEKEKNITEVINNLNEEQKKYFEKWYPIDPFLYEFLKSKPYKKLILHLK